jgi:hypothetical protein
MYEAPYKVATGRFEILVFNRGTRHLEKHSLPLGYRIELAYRALARGRPGATWAFCSYGDATENSLFAFGYLRMAAALLAEGVRGARRELQSSGLADTLSSKADSVAAGSLPPGSPAYPALCLALHHPMTASTHITLAEEYGRMGYPYFRAAELQIACYLDPTRGEPRLTLARVLYSVQEPEAAHEQAVLATRCAEPAVSLEAQQLLIREESSHTTVSVPRQTY